MLANFKRIITTYIFTDKYNHCYLESQNELVSREKALTQRNNIKLCWHITNLLLHFLYMCLEVIFPS